MNKPVVAAVLTLVVALGLAAYSGLFPGKLSDPQEGGSSLNDYLTGEMAALTLLAEPGELSDHIVARADGSPVALKDMAGKAMLINLWASWCIPCRVEMEELANLQKEIGSDTFEVVAVNVDRGGHRMAEEVLAEWGIEGLAVYADPSMQVAFDLADGALPTSFVVNRKGQILAYYLGPLKWDKPEALRLFKALSEGL